MGEVRRRLALLAGLSLILVMAAGAVAAPRAVARPRLVVVIVLDQFRSDYLAKYAPFFGEGGFKWLMRNGANFTNAHYSHATTYTGPGHALILSGSYGHTNSIVGNRWYNPATNRVESMFFDPKAALIGVDSSPRDDDTSPRNFIGNNLADQLLLSNNGRSRAVAVSLKDRAAIMLAGKLGRAFWFHEGAGGILSSTYYMRELPAWVKAFNARKIPESYYGKSWEKSLPEADYSISRTDDFPAETDFKALGRKFPHILTDKSGKPGADFFEAFTATPFANDYEFELARQALENEGLGQDDDPDILGISITPTDIAGHAYGPDSQEVQDLVVRTDRQLSAFLAYLNARFKPGQLLVVLTADHGACPLPEYMAQKGFDAGRIKKKQIADAMEAALTARYGKPDGDAKWVSVLEDPSVFLNGALIAARKLDPAEVQRVAGEAVLGVHGIAAYYTRSQFLNGGLPANRWAAAFEKSFHPERSGDVIVATRPYYFWGKYGESDTGSTHGSPYEYDTHVPLIMAGAGVRAATYNEAVDMADLAPTLATILNLQAPAGNEGHVLAEALDR